MVVDSLAAFLNITFNHHAFYQTADVVGIGAAVEHFLYDTDLLLELLLWFASMMQAGFFKSLAL